MRVCGYTDTFFPDVGGAEGVLDNLARQLVALGHQMVVLAPRPRAPHDDSQYPYTVVRYRRPLSKRLGVRLATATLAKLHWHHRFDLVHCHATYPPGYVAATFRRWFGVPYVVRPHGSDILPGEHICRHPRLAARVAATLADADGIIAQGKYLRGVIEQTVSLPSASARIHIIHNGVDLSQFQPPRQLSQRDADRAHTRSRPYLLSLGNLSHRKGFDLVLRAYAQLTSPARDLVIAGDGPEGPSLQQLAADLGIAARVHFLGHVTGDKKIDCYRQAHAFICASRREPFANVILEAQAAGLPVIATAVGGNTELVQHERNGLLCPSEDVSALAAALARTMDDSPLMVRLRCEVSRLIQRFDWPAIAQEYLALYREVMLARHPAMRRVA